MSDQQLFQDSDEQERELAPQQLPHGHRDRVEADEPEARDARPGDTSEPAPVANMGNAPSAAMAPPSPDPETDFAEHDRDGPLG